MLGQQLQSWAATAHELSEDECSARKGTWSCPRCGRAFSWRHVRYCDGAGEPIGWVNAVAALSQPHVVLLHKAGAETARCPRCDQTWPVFATDAAGALPSAPNVTETRRTLDEWYRQTQWVDNRRGSKELHRTVTIGREWQQSVRVESEASREVGGAGKLSVPSLSELSASAEQSVKAHYSLTQDVTRSYSDQIVIEVPPWTVRGLTLTFKRHWQHGTVRVPAPGASVVELPYSVAVELTADVTAWDQTFTPPAAA
jgi:hypothetical protein